MLGRLPHDTAGLVELDLHVLIQVPRVSFRVLVTIATSQGRRRTVSSKWLEHALILRKSKPNNRLVQDVLRSTVQHVTVQLPLYNLYTTASADESSSKSSLHA